MAGFWQFDRIAMGTERPLRQWLFVFAVVAAGGCLLSPQPDPPGILDAEDQHDGGTGRDGDVGPVPDALGDAAADGTDEVDGGYNFDESCPTDPEDGRAGAPCTGDDDCGSGFGCVQEYDDADPAGTSWTDYLGGYCVPIPPGGTACEIGAADACPPGARCVVTGVGGAPATARCLDACSPADTTGRLYGANCDCRGGYRCDLSLEVCVPGCTADHECCALWQDANEDGIRQFGELTADAECSAHCDLHTFECIYDGDPAARIGDPCRFGAECPAGARCWRSPEAERDGLPGFCLVERCDLPGRGCPEGSACVVKDPGVGFDAFCARPCFVDAVPGGDADRCGDGATCVPAFFDGAVLGDGACLPGI